jgi:pilus assembly protein Flp/PilA
MGVNKVLKMFRKLAVEERGQGMTEYGLILALLVIGVIAVLVVMGPKLAQKFKNVSDNL